MHGMKRPASWRAAVKKMKFVPFLLREFIGWILAIGFLPRGRLVSLGLGEKAIVCVAPR